MNKAKVLQYASGIVLFGMYWAMFGFVSNWWIGLVIAVGLFGLQALMQRMLNDVEIK